MNDYSITISKKHYEDPPSTEYVAEFSDIIGIIGVGDTPGEALRIAMDARSAYFEGLNKQAEEKETEDKELKETKRFIKYYDEIIGFTVVLDTSKITKNGNEILLKDSEYNLYLLDMNDNDLILQGRIIEEYDNDTDGSGGNEEVSTLTISIFDLNISEIIDTIDSIICTKSTDKK